MIAALGAFDGFHRGHALLFERAKILAFPLNLEWGAITFDPHPGLFMRAISGVLFTSRERELIRLFLEIPRLVSLKFDEELARFSPDLFWEYLREKVVIEGIVVGQDFRFGYRRTGDVALLERYCREGDIPFLSVDILEYLGSKISSSVIRGQVVSGQCELAISNLGYPYFLWSEVVHGLGRGRELGFPTANLSVPSFKLLPADGVYAVAVLVKGKWKAGALSIGKNPTFTDISDIRVEVFILDYEGDLYDESLPVFFLSRLRPQVPFKDVDQLVMQIDADSRRARTVFRHSFAQHTEWYAGFLIAYVELLSKLGCEIPKD
ncbi:MAG: riboflavin biosynthesis protein RibF [Synergistaceae bacterium]|jgi:riboflavin kinase/FMN adenylyltransferase|nr:riboflavin biosynthesis protein RibF [Synergistaceae bacterium]